MNAVTSNGSRFNLLPMNVFSREMNRWIDELNSESKCASCAPASIWESDVHFHLEFDLPGVHVDDVDEVLAPAQVLRGVGVAGVDRLGEGAVAPAHDLESGNRAQQPAGVRMQRTLEQAANVGLFHLAARVHHDHPLVVEHMVREQVYSQMGRLSRLGRVC